MHPEATSGWLSFLCLQNCDSPRNVFPSVFLATFTFHFWGWNILYHSIFPTLWAYTPKYYLSNPFPYTLQPVPSNLEKIAVISRPFTPTTPSNNLYSLNRLVPRPHSIQLKSATMGLCQWKQRFTLNSNFVTSFVRKQCSGLADTDTPNPCGEALKNLWLNTRMTLLSHCELKQKMRSKVLGI